MSQYLRQLREDFALYARCALKIRTKSGAVEPLALNAAQLYLHARLEEQRQRVGYVRALALKGRQQGISTYITGRYFWKATGTVGLNVGILTHLDDATQNLFGMVRRYYDHLPTEIKPTTKANSGTALQFSRLDSGYKIATAGSRGAGRSSTLQLFHGCLSPNTLIVDGASGALRRMGDFSIGELVRTHTGAMAPVTFISRQRKPALKVAFRGLRDFPLVSTGEHRFWTPNGWAELSDLSAGDMVGFPVPEIRSDHSGWLFRLPNTPRPQGGGSGEVGPDRMEPTFDLGRVLGLYLAEGSIKTQSDGEPCGVVFTVHEREVGRTVAWLNALGGFQSLKVKPRRDSKTVVVTVYGRSFSRFVRLLCGSVDGKHLPYEWHRCGHEFVRGLVIGYLSGDGHFSAERDRRISATSIRSAITTGMREAIAALGYGWAGVEFKEAAVRNRRNEKEAFVLRLCGPGVDALSADCDKPCVPRRRICRPRGATVSDGYAWVPIVSIEPAGEVEVMDFEVGHEDHSYCTIHGATHNSEVAFWPHAEEHMAGIGQALPLAPGTEAVLETTANGLGNLFHRMWQAAERGESEYIPVFIPWHWQPEYRMAPKPGFVLTEEEDEYMELHGVDIDQIAWRRSKIETDFGGDKDWFTQEYPATAAEAFVLVGADSYIKGRDVLIAQQVEIREPVGPLIIGVDPARFGDASTCIARRRGRKAFPITAVKKQDTMEVAGRLAHILREERPAKMFIDVGGLGAGIVDRLMELGFGKVIEPVNFGAEATQDDRYFNKRAEMWGEMKDWLRARASIPKDDALHSDLTGPQYSYDSRSRVKLETKESMRKRGVASPDRADALALTFAAPVQSTEVVTEKWRDRLPRGTGNPMAG